MNLTNMTPTWRGAADEANRRGVRCNAGSLRQMSASGTLPVQPFKFGQTVVFTPAMLDELCTVLASRQRNRG